MAFTYDVNGDQTRYPLDHWSSRSPSRSSNVDFQFCSYPSIVSPAAGKAAVAYTAGGFTEYATNSGGSWYSVSVVSGISRPALRLDSAGNAHLLYQRQPGALEYVTNFQGRQAALHVVRKLPY